MTRLEYDLLREDRPDLRLPSWEDLPVESRARTECFTRKRLIACRSAVILGADFIDERGFSHTVGHAFDS